MAIATNFTYNNINGVATVQREANPLNTVPIFGAMSKEVGTYPNDAVLIDVYNFTNDYLETIPRARYYQLTEAEFKINVESELHRVNYLSGKYNLVAKFHRNIFGSSDGDKIVIQEISSDRLEVRVTIQDNTLVSTNNNLYEFFTTGLFALDKKSILPNLYIFSNLF